MQSKRCEELKAALLLVLLLALLGTADKVLWDFLSLFPPHVRFYFILLGVVGTLLAAVHKPKS